MRPPSARMMKDVVVLRFGDVPATGSGDGLPTYADPGITLQANVSAPEMVAAEVALQRVASLRCRVMCWTNPDGVDPRGVTRKLRKGDGVMWQGRLWHAVGPMVPESKATDGTPVNYRFDIEVIA